MAKNGMRKIKLKEVCERITVGHVGPMADKYTTYGIPFLRSQNISAFRLNLDDIKFIPPEFHDKLRKSALRSGDVAVVRTGYPGTACVIPDNFKELNCADLVVITPSGELNPYYLAAIFNSSWGMASVAGNLVGVAQQHFNIGAARELEVSLPARQTQDRIASILSAYDEMIENSQRRIKILEQMARNLYREWFIHFRFPNHTKTPMVDSPFGKIPKGWMVKKLGELADISWGDTSTTKASYVEEGYAAYSASGLDGKLNHYDYDQTGIVLSAIGAQCGKTWLARGKWSCIKNTIRFWSKDDSASTEFLFISTAGQNFWPRRGAAQPFISQGDAERIDLLTPDVATMKRFTVFAADSLEQKAMLQAQIENLRKTRDLLLPRLMSGQINVN
jgi:type I restriction enzyme S subunit